MIAAGIDAKAITTYLGHSSIQVTFDLYGHLTPGNEEAAVAQAIGSTRPGGHIGFVGYQHVELSTADLLWSQVHPAWQPGTGAPLPPGADRPDPEPEDRSGQGVRPRAASQSGGQGLLGDGGRRAAKVLLRP
jgi:hypothetical protein